jgi:hypothetical protein
MIFYPPADISLIAAAELSVLLPPRQDAHESAQQWSHHKLNSMRTHRRSLVMSAPRAVEHIVMKHLLMLPLAFSFTFLRARHVLRSGFISRSNFSADYRIWNWASRLAEAGLGCIWMQELRWGIRVVVRMDSELRSVSGAEGRRRITRALAYSTWHQRDWGEKALAEWLGGN